MTHESNVRVGCKHLSRNLQWIAVAAFFCGLGAIAPACAESDSISSSGSTNPTTSSSGMGGSGGNMSSSSSGSSGSVTSSSSSSSSSGMGGSGGGGGSGGTGGVPAVCGDGLVEGLEACDDGNTMSGDGCTDTCVVEPGYTCTGEPSVCTPDCVPDPMEVCDGKDNTCDGVVDEGCICSQGQTQACYSGPMGTENVGKCKAGTQTCDINGTWGPCMNEVTPTVEVCNGLDDDCNKTIDDSDPGGGAACTAAGLGECKKGVEHCQNGAIKCVAAMPTPEVCDGLDNNCDGNTDEGNPGGGTQCMTGLLGLCGTGLTQCDGVNGVICKPNVVPGQLMESCNGLDDDCDGMVDDAITQVGMPCTASGFSGICQFGTYVCPTTPPIQLTCDHPLPGTVQETCNSKDDDCNGIIDDPALLNGQMCTTAFPGICSAGTTQCSGGSLNCVATVQPGSQPEICDSKDNNCDGQVDNLNATPVCSQQNPMAQFVTTWACTMGTCQILQCNLGYADINGAPGDGCECVTDQWATACNNATTISVAKGGTATMSGKIETANGSDWVTFSFVGTAVGQAWHPSITLTNSAGGQYAMDVMKDCNTAATCNDNGTGTNASLWEQNYNGYVAGVGCCSDMTTRQTAWKVRVYRVNGTQPTCDQYTVTASNP